MNTRMQKVFYEEQLPIRHTMYPEGTGNLKRKYTEQLKKEITKKYIGKTSRSAERILKYDIKTNKE